MKYSTANNVIMTLILVFVSTLSSCIQEVRKMNGDRVVETDEPERKEKVWQLNEFAIGPSWSDNDRSIDMIISPYPENAPDQYTIPDLLPVGNQGIQASGTAWAAGYLAMTLLMRKTYKDEQVYVCSPAYIYNRLNGGENMGIEIFKALTLLKESGCPDTKFMPYREYDYIYSPSVEAETNASKYKINGYNRIDVGDINQIKTHLLNNHPIIFTMRIYKNFINLEDLYWDGPVGITRGRHTMAVVGYNDKEEYFLIQNSAGKEWGDDGIAAIPYSWFIRLCDRAYIIW